MPTLRYQKQKRKKQFEFINFVFVNPYLPFSEIRSFTGVDGGAGAESLGSKKYHCTRTFDGRGILNCFQEHVKEESLEL